MTAGPSFGECHACGRSHEIGEGRARPYALEMMREFRRIRRLDYLAPEREADPRLSFDALFPAGQGNMFGVLECEDVSGETIFLRAFSSLREGVRQIEGWVPPVLSAEDYACMILPAQREIKRMTSEMDELDPATRSWAELHGQRKRVSQDLWRRMCASYRFRNFRGEERSLAGALMPGAPMAGGMGECCAPKLLNHAARHGLRPKGLIEFYWGEDKGSGRRKSGEFYPRCEARCRPLLGFLLCGLAE